MPSTSHHHSSSKAPASRHAIPALKAELAGKTTRSRGPITFRFDTTAVSKEDLSKGFLYWLEWTRRIWLIVDSLGTGDGEGEVKSTMGCQWLNCCDNSRNGACSDLLKSPYLAGKASSDQGRMLFSVLHIE